MIYSKRPKVTFGINNSFTIHDFEFSFFIYSRLGQWIDYEFNRGYNRMELEIVLMWITGLRKIQLIISHVPIGFMGLEKLDIPQL